MQAESGDMFRGRDLIFRPDNPLTSTVFDIGPTDDADDTAPTVRPIAQPARRKPAKATREPVEDDGFDQTGWS
ncbi:hypothetical protein E6W36_06680 [Hankyongella ginsenosidimutans]|uniref:Uncharacterized protein n=1 Tax=Hankyongella ginsenosidimutans TaxID=1763828 RepID=A0A4D7C2Q8_9SPHN|nr:hypothetical protein [Hankyongella ginsenosidimutans]QCI79351.1 hypothetical protein E6W36_06680 [Hankyongella ginsenosidimutans]